MINKQFAESLSSDLIQELCDDYISLLEEYPIENATDKYWIEILGLYRKESDHVRALLLKIMRRTMIDTVSTVLGVIDGESNLGNKSYNFIILDKKSGEKVNGELQEMFLQNIELIMENNPDY